MSGIRGGPPMDIRQATDEFEHWLGRFCPLVRPDLERKHAKMAASAVVFLRATFDRWMQRWPKTCGELDRAPAVLAVGDAHVENFGTWRDAEGRLVWGVNDFDEAYALPYTNDLVRLATSAHLAISANSLALKPADACAAILRGYAKGLNDGGCPFVFAEKHEWLRSTVLRELSDPQKF